MRHVGLGTVIVALLLTAGSAASSEVDPGVSLVFVADAPMGPDFWAAQVEAFSGSHQVLTVDLTARCDDVQQSATVEDLVDILRQAPLELILLVAHGDCERIAAMAAAQLPGREIAAIEVPLEGDLPMQRSPEKYNELLRKRLDHLLSPATPCNEDFVSIDPEPLPTAEELLTPSILEAIVASNASVKRCRVGASEELPADIHVRLHVHPDGHVSDVTVVSQPPPGTDVGDCLCREIERIMFPEFEGQTTPTVAIIPAP